MAQGNIFGMLSGKIGSVVVYERNGKQIVRSNPKQRDPKTCLLQPKSIPLF